MTTAVSSFNPFAEGFTDDPYPHFSELRATNPVEQNELGFWALWRYADVAEVLRARLSVQDDKVVHQGPMADVYEQVYAEKGIDAGVVSMLDLDPPDHTRLRKLVSQAFTPRRVEELAGMVERLVDDALDAIDAAGEVDLIDALAFPLPFSVISLLLGMPETPGYANCPAMPFARSSRSRMRRRSGESSTRTSGSSSSPPRQSRGSDSVRPMTCSPR